MEAIKQVLNRNCCLIQTLMSIILIKNGVETDAFRTQSKKKLPTIC